MNQTLLNTLFAAMGLVMVALIGMVGNLIIEGRKTRSLALSNQTNAEIAKETASAAMINADASRANADTADRAERRAENKELRDEIAELSKKVEALRAELTASIKNHQKSEQAREAAEQQCAAAKREASEWEQKYRDEQAACDLYAQLAWFTQNGRTPDPAMLAILGKGLRDLGFPIGKEAMPSPPASPNALPDNEGMMNP